MTPTKYQEEAMFKYIREYFSLLFGRGTNRAKVAEAPFSTVLASSRPDIVRAVPRSGSTYFRAN